MDRYAVDPAAVDAAGAVDVQGAENASVCGLKVSRWSDGCGWQIDRADTPINVDAPLAIIFDSETEDENDDRRPTGESKPLALKMAAAPELLAALEWLQTEINKSIHAPKDFQPYMCGDVIRRAIAKATGTAH